MTCIAKTKQLLQGKMQDYSKLLKIIQYYCVITSEFELFNYHFRGIGMRSFMEGLIGGGKLNDQQRKDFKQRWKILGSSISTSRMATRFGEFIYSASYFIKEYKAIKQAVANGTFKI